MYPLNDIYMNINNIDINDTLLSSHNFNSKDEEWFTFLKYRSRGCIYIFVWIFWWLPICFAFFVCNFIKVFELYEFKECILMPFYLSYRNSYNFINIYKSVYISIHTFFVFIYHGVLNIFIIWLHNYFTFFYQTVAKQISF